MSTIPPNVVSSVLQSPTAQHQAARSLDNERGQLSDAAAAGGRLKDRAAQSIGESDGDARVDADAEGFGSQGRRYDEAGPTDQEQADDPGASASDAPTPSGPPRLDLQA